MAALIGAVAGGTAFLLSGLFLGPWFALIVALVAVGLAWRRRRTPAVLAFAIAALLSALAIWLPAIVQLAGAGVFVAGLHLSVRSRPAA